MRHARLEIGSQPGRCRTTSLGPGAGDWARHSRGVVCAPLRHIRPKRQKGGVARPSGASVARRGGRKRPCAPCARGMGPGIDFLPPGGVIVPPEGRSSILGHFKGSIFLRMAWRVRRAAWCAWLPHIRPHVCRIFCADCTAPQFLGPPRMLCAARSIYRRTERPLGRFFRSRWRRLSPGERLSPTGGFLVFFRVPMSGQFPAVVGCVQGLLPADCKGSGRNRLRLRDLQRSSWRIFSHMDAESSGHFSQWFSRARNYAREKRRFSFAVSPPA